MPNTSVMLSGIELSNPLIPASGTFGFGHEFAGLYDINVLGSIALKGTTREPRIGNPLPRIAECEGGMINSVGLQNPGVHAVIDEELPKLAQVFHKPAIANISGFSVEDYAYCAALFDNDPRIGWLEINVSCPNVSHGGMSLGTDPASAAAVTRAVRAVAKKPVFIKLTPNVTDIVAGRTDCHVGASRLLAMTSLVSIWRMSLRGVHAAGMDAVAIRSHEIITNPAGICTAIPHSSFLIPTLSERT